MSFIKIAGRRETNGHKRRKVWNTKRNTWQ